LNHGGIYPPPRRDRVKSGDDNIKSFIEALWVILDLHMMATGQLQSWEYQR